MKSRLMVLLLILNSSVIILAISCSAKAQNQNSVENDSLKTEVNIQQDTSDTTEKNNELQQFREAFEKVLSQQQKIKQKKKVKKDPTLDLGVFIINRTRTTMGRQFYHLFYQNWQAPKDVGNAVITISEKPLPGLGSQISIKIGYEKAFQARLQPKHRYILALSKLAIKRCRKIIQQKAKIRKQLAGY